ncbi:MAG: FAD-binding protein, partial [Armatimonadetes bacterium]|nr:FAD-binding protein [Armatimonadota bacterium]
ESARNQMTNIPGLYAAGECEYQYHGANRLGANALLSCLTGGELTAMGVQSYLKNMPATGDDLASSIVDDAVFNKRSQYETIMRSTGKENPYKVHQDLTELMWNNCGIWRVQRDLLNARDGLNDIADRAKNCASIDGSPWANQSAPFTRSLQHMIEMSKAIVGAAIVRDESRGAHFKMDTPDRDDTKWLCTTKAMYKEAGPEFDLSEKISCDYIAPRARKYKINQNKIVKEIMGEDALAGIGK